MILKGHDYNGGKRILDNPSCPGLPELHITLGGGANLPYQVFWIWLKTHFFKVCHILYYIKLIIVKVDFASAWLHWKKKLLVTIKNRLCQRNLFPPFPHLPTDLPATVPTTPYFKQFLNQSIQLQQTLGPTSPLLCLHLLQYQAAPAPATTFSTTFATRSACSSKLQDHLSPSFNSRNYHPCSSSYTQSW